VARLIAVHPVLNVRDVRRAARWYSQLGFDPIFADNDERPTYGGIRRDDVELHLQWHSEQEWSDGLDGTAYRFLVDDPDALRATFAKDLIAAREVTDTAWGTREFGLYDPDGNALFFYRDR
jgi:catechol 2,3-dioxygenase-like lactoylglutathione lyase family enzyme